ncbi:TIGR02301 family protein [Notoacmeibacter sp. MSK16QG-6]|uniref:TIGR02301 family protein n=1 Tax=Notoacmeibacter sp. MSK16QG-6 TaxID=2957982 RepID=UPI0020A1F4F9|nr:TIGR02301 family protein [Notoacmeibacter sp. MSK16QG-6]MCP1198022.1 TIGR02301 family protein [Notoacmeibacter sp. MSK16QG-6]
MRPIDEIENIESLEYAALSRQRKLMIFPRPIRSSLIVTVLLAMSCGVMAQTDGDQTSETEAEEKPAVTVESAESTYLPDLVRLAEISGSMQYLRSLCGQDNDSWRQAVGTIIANSGGNEAIERRLTAAYNRGYRRYASYHRQCTTASVNAAERFRVEGRLLAKSLVDRFGN